MGVQFACPRGLAVPPRSVLLPELSRAKNSTLASVPVSASTSAWSVTGWPAVSVMPAGGLSRVTDWRLAAEGTSRTVTAAWVGEASVAPPVGPERLTRKSVLPEERLRLMTGTVMTIGVASPSAQESVPLTAW